MTNYVKTTNFLRKDSLPDASPEKIIRGSEFDTEFNNLVIAVASKANLISPVLTGIPMAPTASYGSSTTQIATTAFTNAALAGAFITGMIMMWSGTQATIPDGWAACSGSNGTPDLRDRFVIGAGNKSPDATGGEANAVVVAHTHTGTAVAAGSHVHMQSGQTLGPGSGGYAFNSGNGANNTINTQPSGTHTHTVNVASSGVSATNANLPPYYALFYIMKL